MILHYVHFNNDFKQKEYPFSGDGQKHPNLKSLKDTWEEGHMTVKQVCEIINVSRSALYRKLQDRA